MKLVRKDKDYLGWWWTFSHDTTSPSAGIKIIIDDHGGYVIPSIHVSWYGNDDVWTEKHYTLTLCLFNVRIIFMTHAYWK